jgi:uncharacterized membrane protein
MNIVNIIKLTLILLVLDAIYLFSTRGFAKKVIGSIQNTPLELKPFPTFLVYVFIVSLIYKFIIEKNASLYEAFLLGILTYGIYDLTNMATLKNWSPMFALMDTLWGGILFTLSVWIYRQIN